MKYLFILLSILMLISSCSKKIYNVSNGNFIETIDFEDFELYVFKLKGSKLKKETPNKHIEFENGLGNKQTLVYEELYLFLEKEGGKQRALYFTTLSHKYIYKGGVFNNSLYDKYIPINQIDFLYTGYYNNNEIKFNNPNEKRNKNINFSYTLSKDILEITKITNYSAKKRERNGNPVLDISKGDVFGIRMQFTKDLVRNFIYERGGIITPITKFHHNGEDLFFEIMANSEFKYMKLLNRIKFNYPSIFR